MIADELARRTEALEAAVAVIEDRVRDADLVDAAAAARATIAKVRERLGRGTGITVTALAGPTGAGKSTLFNALAGTDLSATGVRRPTTTGTAACVWGEGGDTLLDWLDVKQRHRIEAGTPLDGLVLLDLPDHDSIASEHRREVDRLVELVDLLVWVTDFQKYADRAMHADFVTRLAGHGAVLLFVLNKIDLLTDDDARAVAADLAALVAADGVAEPRVVAVSTVTGAGLDDLRRLVAERVRAEQAAVLRLDADLRGAADGLASSGSAGPIDKAVRRTLVDGFEAAVGVDAVSAIAARQYRRDAHQSTAWPPTRLLRRWRRHPVADLPRIGTGRVDDGHVHAALRDASETVAGELATPWARAVRHAALDLEAAAADGLDGVVVDVTRADRRRPRWWTAVNWLQRLAGTVALAGFVWLVGVAVATGFLRIDADPLLVPVTDAPELPLPSVLLLAGVVVGLVAAVVSRIVGAAGARRHAHRTRRRIRDDIARVVEDVVVAELGSVLADRARTEELLRSVQAPLSIGPGASPRPSPRPSPRQARRQPAPPP